MSPFYQDQVLDSLFSTRDPVYHKNLKRPVAQLFSMTNMRNYEPYADECSAIFIDSMRDMQNRVVDLSTWLQWYAFDVIACITFQRRFGFMEQRADINNMIGDLDGIFSYVKVVGQYPKLHPWLMGSRAFVSAVKRLLPNLPDPVYTFLKVFPQKHQTLAPCIDGEQITEDEIVRHDREEKQAGRTDFLSQLRAKEAKDGQLSHSDIMNHLSNNMYVWETLNEGREP
jgi:hypothetical protein